MKTETLTHKDVRGNELLYLKLTDEKTGNEVLINIGQKTFDAVTNLTNLNKKTEYPEKNIINELERKNQEKKLKF